MRAAKSRRGVRLVIISVITTLALVACPTPFGYYDTEGQLAELAESEGATPQAVETPIASVRPQLLGPEPADDYTALAAGETALRSSAHYVRFDTATPDARIYVVEGGQELSTADTHLYNGEPILVTGGTTRTFHFIAVKRLMYPSAAVTVTVSVDNPFLPVPSFDPAPGVYERTANESASIVKPIVSVDGVTVPAEEITLHVTYTKSPSAGQAAPAPSDPTTATTFSGPIELTGSTLGPIEYRIKAIAHHPQLGTSTVAYAEYLVVTDLPEMPAPEFDLTPGTYGEWENRTLTFTKPTVEIDGHVVPPEEIELFVEYTVSPSPGESAPEPSNPIPDGTPFTGTIELTGSTAASVEYRVKAIAYHRYLGTSSVTYGVYTIVRPGIRYYITGSTDPWGVTENDNAMTRAFPGSWVRVTFAELEQANLNNILNTNTSFIYIDGSDSNASDMASYLNTDDRLGAFESWVYNGGRLFLNAAPNQGGDINFGFGGVTLRYSTDGSMETPSAAAVDLLHAIFAGPDPTVTAFTGTEFGHAVIEAAEVSPILVEVISEELQLNRVVLAERTWGSGRVMFGGMTTTNFHSPQPAGDNLRSNILTYLGG